MEYLGRHDLVQVPPMGTSTDVTLPPVPKKIAPSTQAQMAESKGGLSEHLGQMMGDAPFCSSCGHVTVRNGACYKCLNCGNSMGCS
jgi:ribonucleoside-diphosphate reductase alpha chain